MRYRIDSNGQCESGAAVKTWVASNAYFKTGMKSLLIRAKNNKRSDSETLPPAPESPGLAASSVCREALVFCRPLLATRYPQIKRVAKNKNLYKKSGLTQMKTLPKQSR